MLIVVVPIDIMTSMVAVEVISCIGAVLEMNWFPQLYDEARIQPFNSSAQQQRSAPH
jgi:hypothetical protein